MQSYIALFTILAGAIGIALILCTERLAGRMQARNREYDRIFEDGEYSILADRFFEDAEKELKAKPQYWDILREFNEWLCGNQRILHSHPAGLSDGENQTFPFSIFI